MNSIHWRDVPAGSRVYIRDTEKGGNSFYVVVPKGSTSEKIADWSSFDASEAQDWLDSLAAQTE